ncbi:MAG: glycerophosphodiester phosphodiesterase [Candidatus Saccharibacteria bacterium]
MLVIGHRGAAGLAPENTVSSLQQGEIAASAIEFDLRKTRDGRIVVVHDESLKRTLGINRKLKRLSLAEVKSVSRQEGKEVPTLSEWLSAASNFPLNPEIKETGFEAEALKLLREFASKVLVITSWNPLVLKRIRALDGNIPLGAIIAKPLGPFLRLYLKILKMLGVRWITLAAGMASDRVIAKLKQAGMKIFVYTINDPRDAARLEQRGVDGIFTDYPNLMVKQYDKSHSLQPNG